ncbi:MAG: hemolysin family protein [Candidatus Omnitrophota bacterium]
MELNTIINILIFPLLLFFSSFFSASETALFSLSKVNLRRLKERYPRAKTIGNLLRNPTGLLSVIVFGNMLVNIAISSLSTALFVEKFGKWGFITAIVSSGTLILFFGEILPKSIAIYAAEKVSLRCAGALAVFSKISYWAIYVIGKIVDYFSAFIIRCSRRKGLSDDELKIALLLSRDQGQISEAEEEIISNVLEFKDTWVSEILTARIDIKGIDITLDQKDTINYLKEAKHSKVPVYEGSLDKIVGILYAKDLFLNPGQDYHKLMRKPFFVPESKRIDDVLKEFLDTGERIAVVLDEYGGTEGIVTLEDIEEEIFGEVYDEFETPRELIEKIHDFIYRVYGKTPIKTVNLELDLDLPEDEDTVAGFLLSAMEKIPKPKEKFEFKNAEFIIERATARRVVSVLLIKTKK